MFKSLLRTIPSMSGNIILGCKVDNILKTDKVNIFESDIRSASLYPSQNNVFIKKININLGTGSWEHDVRRFYKWYSDIFYSDNYIMNKKDYKKLNLTSNENQDSRNKDYEFGCRRIQYSQYGYQFQFFAPIYIDSADSLPDFFEITIQLRNNIKKKLRILINTDSKYNYIKSYLLRYLDKINDNVVYCLYDSNQATYFGIDVVNGGLTQVKDDVIGVIYNNQMTINNFDNTICQGFNRKKLIMRQVIPLAFMFNISDILNKNELSVFMNSPVNITGYYYKNGVKCDFYDFDINYTEYYPKYKKYDSLNGNYTWTYGYYNDFDNYKDLTGSVIKKINVMNVDYPSLNESHYIGYKYTNKITPTYTKWKLKYSDDEHPYITNMSWAYSYLQNPNYKYGTFPTTLRDMLPSAEIDNTNFILPINENINLYYKYIDRMITGKDIQYKSSIIYNILKNNYISEWYNIFTSLENIIHNKKLWSNISEGKTYYNGILYNFNNTEYTDYNKFGVFLNINYKHIDNTVINNIYKSDILISNNADNGYKIPSPTIQTVISHAGGYDIYNSFYNIGETLSNGISYINTKQLMIRDDNGMYIKISDFYKRNTYYKFTDISDIFNNILTCDDNTKKSVISYIHRYVAGVEGSDRQNSINSSVELLQIANNNNIFEQYINDNDDISIRFTLSDLIFHNDNMDTPTYNDNEFIWLKKYLYVVTAESTEKKRLIDIYKNIGNNEMVNSKISVFLYNEFINKQLILNGLIHASSVLNLNQTTDDIWSLLEEYINNLDEYMYIPYSEDNGIVNTGYFIKSNNKILPDTITNDYLSHNEYTHDIVYIDTYNFINFLNVYINSKRSKYNINNSDDIKAGIDAAENMLDRINTGKISLHNFYCRFISRDHIKEYIHNTSKNMHTENGVSIDDMNMPDYYMKHIYAKTRILVVDNNNKTVNVKDMYIPLSDIIKQNTEDLNEFIKRISPVPSYNGYKFKINTDGFIVNNEEYIIDSPDVDNFIYLELCFNKDFMMMTDEIKTMISDTDENLAVYMYKIADGIDKNMDMFPAFTYNDSIYTHVRTNKIYNNNIIHDIYECLEPLYTDIYVNDYDVNKTVHMINTFQIKPVNVLDGDNIYVYSDNTNPVFAEVTENTKKMLPADTEYYSIYLSNKIDIVACDGCNYNAKTKMNTYIDNDGIKYGFYLCNIDIDNSSNTFKITGDEYNNIIFEYINGIPVTEQYIENIFKKMHPFIKKDIFNMFVNSVDTVIFQNPFNIQINYISNLLDNGYTENSYKYKSIYNIETDKTESNILSDNGMTTDKRVYDIKLINNRIRKIKLLRYFDHITPLITKCDIIQNCYGIKYKDFDIDADINNIYNETVSIYKYPGVYVKSYNDVTGNYYTVKKSQYEYKHFNDNKLYNLKPEMSVTYPSYLTYDALLENEKTDITIEYFTKCINKGCNKKYNKNEILFLFNKYKVSYLSEPVKLDIGKSNKLYKLTYKFILI